MSNIPSRNRFSLPKRWLACAVTLMLAVQVLIAPTARGQPLDERSDAPAAGQSDAAALLALVEQQAAAPASVWPRRVNAAPLQPAPQPAAVVVEDSLTGGGLIPTGSCPSGRINAETVAEGLILKVRGPCVGSDTAAAARTDIPGLRIPDGELRLDVKFVAGVERGSLILVLRERRTETRVYGYAFVFGPSSGANIIAFNEGGTQMLASQQRLAQPIVWDDWNTASIRVQGNRLWLLLNDTQVGYAEDGTFTDGGVLLMLSRSGNVNDEAETAAVLRNARVSALADSDASLTPVYERPAPRPVSPSGPPKCDFGEPRLIRDPDGVERWYCDVTDWSNQ